MSKEFTVAVEKGIWGVVIGAVILGGLIILLSLGYLFAKLTITKDVFEDVVINTWLPIFNTLIAAVIGWVFGKPLVNSLAERIKGAKLPN